MSKNKKLPKLSDEQTEQLVAGARMACRGDAIDRFVDSILNVKNPLPPISAEDMDRYCREAEAENSEPETPAAES